MLFVLILHLQSNARALFGRVYMDHCVMTVQAADLERLCTGLAQGWRGSEPLMEGAAAVGDLFLCAEGKELPARGRVIKVRTLTCLLVLSSPMVQVGPLGEHLLLVAPCSYLTVTRTFL
jgi:hypothetical protein